VNPREASLVCLAASLLCMLPAKRGDAADGTSAQSIQIAVGFSPTTYGTDDSGAPFFSLSTARPIASRLAFQGGVSVLSYDDDSDATFVGVAAGSRLYPFGPKDSHKGIFLEACPALYLAIWHDVRGITRGVVPGFQESVGFALPLVGPFGVELAASYFFSSGYERVVLDSEPLKFDGLGQGVVHLRVGLPVSGGE
jgi:hypothetical protein